MQASTTDAKIVDSLGIPAKDGTVIAALGLFEFGEGEAGSSLGVLLSALCAAAIRT